MGSANLESLLPLKISRFAVYVNISGLTTVATTYKVQTRFL